MSMTLVKMASLVLQLLLFGLNAFIPPVWPERTQKVVGFVVGAIAMACTFLGIPLYPAESPAGPLVVAVFLVAFAFVPPLAGMLESKYRKNGQAVYSTGLVPGTSNRFPGHLITNVLGALAASSLVWAAHSTSGFDGFIAGFSNDAAFNIMLPLATIVMFAFARWQQVDACPDIDERARRREPDWEDGITGFSLRHWHQLTNVLYLIAVTFTATTTILYLFAHAMAQAKAGQPLAVSWQVIVTVVVSLGFLYACGGPWSREHRAVYLTFLTGTPAALGAVLVWLSLFSEDPARNIAAMSIVGIGYVLYCVEVVLGIRRRGEKLQLHYFSAAGIAVVLAVLLSALYLS
jgi:hypothetical protein